MLSTLQTQLFFNIASRVILVAITHTVVIMSNVISSFLVGIGFDFDKKSAQQIESGIDSIKSKALQLGSVVAGAFGAFKLAQGFADDTNKLVNFGKIYGVVADDVKALGFAFTETGGSLESAMGSLEKLERFRAGLEKGDASFIASFGIAQGDANDIINATDSVQALTLIAEQFKNATQTQRINMADALGFDEAGLLLLSKGSNEVSRLIAKYKEINTDITPGRAADANEFKINNTELNANIKSVGDTIGAEILPVINDITGKINSWFNDERLSKIEALAGLTRAALGGGTAEQNAQSTGLPSWLFTTDSTSTGKALGLPSWLTSPISNLFPSSGDVNSVVPSGQFMAPNPYMQQIEEPAPAWLYRQTPASPLMPEDQPPPMSQRSSSSTQNINVSLNLDGQVIDRRVVRVVDGMAQTAMDDISSSTRG